MRFFKRLKKKLKPVGAVASTPVAFPESETAHRFLDGLNGIEIGGNVQNSFGLERTGGAYANVDFDATQSAKWQSDGFPVKPVNIVANGDALPFKDNTLDYVLTSHVIEHFFDPIRALKEWIRVVRPSGYVFMIVPHKDRTYDKLRPVTSVDELMKRHNGVLKPSDYLIGTIAESIAYDLPADYMKRFEGIILDGFERLTDDSVTKVFGIFIT